MFDTRSGSSSETPLVVDQEPSPDDDHSYEDVPNEPLADAIADEAGELAAATCRWLLKVGEFDARGGWAQLGCKTPGQWLSWQCGSDSRTAAQQLRVARALRKLRLLREAFSEGKLSCSKVRAITLVATKENEEVLVEIALHSTAGQLRRLIGAYRKVQDIELEKVHQNILRRFVRYYFEEDGSFRLSARLSPEDGALLVKAIEASRQSKKKQRSSPGLIQQDDTAEARHADALVRVAAAALKGEAVAPPNDLRQVMIHVDAETMFDDSGDRCEVEGGKHLHPETVRRLTCGSGLMGVLFANGRPVAVGRKSRGTPPWLRKAMRSVSTGCTFPGCNYDVYLDSHHIQGWSEGGETSLENLTELCFFHHVLCHEGRHSVERLEDGTLRFRKPDGSIIDPAPQTSERYRGDLNVEVEDQVVVPNWDGSRMDVGYVTEVLGQHDFPCETAVPRAGPD